MTNKNALPHRRLWRLASRPARRQRWAENEVVVPDRDRPLDNDESAAPILVVNGSPEMAVIAG